MNDSDKETNRTDKNQIYLQQRIFSSSISKTGCFEKTLLNRISPEKEQKISIPCTPISVVHNTFFSPDGSLILGAFWINVVHLWDAKTLKCLRTFKLDDCSTENLAVFPDWNSFLIEGPSNSFSHFDLNSGKFIREFQGHKRRVTSLAVSPDGNTFFSGSFDDSIRVWDKKTGKCIQILEGHKSGIFALQPLSDGKRLLSGSADKTLRLWDLHSGECLEVMLGHTDWVWSLVFSEQLQIIASAGNDSNIRIRDLYSGRCLHVLKGHRYTIKSLALSPDGRTLVSSIDDNDHTMRWWDILSGRLMKVLPGDNRNAVFSPDGKVIAFGGYRQIELRDSKEGFLLGTLKSHSFRSQALVFSPDGELLAFSCGRKINIWNIKTGDRPAVFEGHTEEIFSLAFNPDSSLLATGSDDHTVRLWDVKSAKCLQTLFGHTKPVISVKFSPDGEKIFSSSEDETIRIWDISREISEKTITTKTRRWNSVDVSPDGSLLLSSGWDSNLRLWDTKTGELVHTFFSYQRNPALFCPDGETILSSNFRTVTVFDRKTKGSIHEIKEFNHHIGAIAISPDGKTFAVGDEDKNIYLYDLHGRTRLLEFSGHNRPINSLSISPDGNLLASASDDETIKIWNKNSGELLATCYSLYEGFLWTTPPDEQASNGWLYTDRPDLVSLYEEVNKEEASKPDYIYEEDERFQNFMKLYNDPEMVFKRVNQPERFDEILKLRSANQQRMLQDQNFSRGEKLLRFLPG